MTLSGCRAFLAALFLSLSLPVLAQAQAAPAASPTAMPATRVEPYVVALVPGHGGADPGAVFPENSSSPQLEEKNLTLPIALKLRDRLQAEDVKVVMTRTGDTTTTGEQRAAIAEKAGANIFVAIHINSFYEDTSIRGAEAEFFSDQNLTNDVADGLLAALGSFDMPVRTSKNREQDNILSMPGVIVEAGYISNDADRQLIQDPNFQSAVAEGVYQGILKYAPEIGDLKARLEAQKAADARDAAAAAQQTQASKAAAHHGPPVLLSAAALLAIIAVLGARIRSLGRRSQRRRSTLPRTRF